MGKAYQDVMFDFYDALNVFMQSYFPVVFPETSLTETSKLRRLFFSKDYFKNTSFSSIANIKHLFCITFLIWYVF